MKALSFFTGCMGLDLGVERAGFEIVAACEIEAAARKPHEARSAARGTITLNRPNLHIYDGIDAYMPEPSHYGIDLVFGGPPCQSFSVAGSRKGLDDPRGQLLFKFAGIINRLKPKAFILENVPGLLTDNEGKTFLDLISEFQSVGYKTTAQIYDAADFGVAQRRKRLIVVGSLVRKPLALASDAQPVTLRDVIADLQGQPGESMKASPCVMDALDDLRWRVERLKWDALTHTLTTKPGSSRKTAFVHPVEDRCLSVEECKRLQGLPDDWALAGSTRQKYTQLGNAVPVPLAYAAAVSAREAIRAHAFLSPSGAERWLACNASPFREQKRVDSSSSAAAEGTAAHELLEAGMRDMSLNYKTQVNLTAENGIKFGLSMCKTIAKVRREVVQRYPGLNWQVEKQVKIYKAFELDQPWIWGTADLVAGDSDRLIIADLKYGRYPVSPEGNKQLMMYAIGVAFLTRWKHKTIDLVILQPRTGGELLQVHTMTREDLQAKHAEFKDQIHALLATGATSKAVPGAHCFFCKARHDCEEKATAKATRLFGELLD